MSNSVKELKRAIREKIWNLLENKDIARFPRPVYNRIPNFQGAEKAAEKLFKTNTWIESSVVKINPDSPQRFVRYRALIDNKLVIMASPKLRQGFVLLDPRSIPSSKYSNASTITGALKYGKFISLKQLPKVDFVVTGCVAVDLKGNRVGKGGGYGELEYAILREIGSIDETTPVATTIHDLQIVDNIPRERHDLTVDIIATPTKLIYVNPRPVKPKGIYWDILGDKAELLVIKELKTILGVRNSLER